MSVEQSVEWLAREAEVLRENLSQSLFVHHKHKLSDPGSKPDHRSKKPETNRLSNGTAGEDTLKKDVQIFLLIGSLMNINYPLQ
jgi:hypothetical protein